MFLGHLGLVGTTLALRFLPILLWPHLPLIRDEQSYAGLADALARGEGILPTAHGWLWAPLFPAFLAVHRLLFGTVLAARVTQVLLAGLTVLLVVRLGRRFGGARVGLVAGWIYALEPTLAAFSHYLWTEHLYIFWMLLAIECAFVSRERGWVAAPAGVFAGLAALTRGVGLYAIPLLAAPLLAGRIRSPEAWRRAGLFLLAGIAVLLPYSAYVSAKFDGAIVVDTSVGFNMWLGNNTFEPVSFDYQMGGDSLGEADFASLGGRPECWSGLPIPEKNSCEIRNGLAFIRERPGLFVRRIWTREAQTFNPASFLVRAIRRGLYEGLPGWAGSALVLAALASHFVIVGAAALGFAAAAPGFDPAPSGSERLTYWWTALFVTLYHLAAAGALIGLSRFRVPLVPLWLPFAALTLAWPAATLGSCTSRWPRALVAVGLFVLVMTLSSIYLGRAFPASP